MNSTANANATSPTVTLRKGTWGDRYNVDIDGTHIGWVTRPSEVGGSKMFGAYACGTGCTGVRLFEVPLRRDAVAEVLYYASRTHSDFEVQIAARAAYLNHLGA